MQDSGKESFDRADFEAQRRRIDELEVAVRSFLVTAESSFYAQSAARVWFPDQFAEFRRLCPQETYGH